MSKPLDNQIVDVSSLVSILLVFVFAYFSALLPIVEEARSQPNPAANADTAALRRRLARYRLIAGALMVVTTLLMLLLLPLTIKVIQVHPWHGEFDTLRVGLLVVQLLLLGTTAGIIVEIALLTKRHRTLA